MEGNQTRKSGRRWAAGIASTLAAALLAGGGIAVALHAQEAQPQAAADSTTQAAGDDESLASLTSLDDLAPDVAQPAALVEPAAAATPSPSASGSAAGAAAGAAKHPARAALRRVLAVIIRQDGTAQYGPNAQKAARAAVNRFPAAFRHLPAKMQQDLWTLAGAAADQEVSDAQAVKDNALNGTYGPEVQKLAQAIQKAPAKSPAPSPSPSAGS
ncbi:hypothetical protein [Sinomonas gamaensis]|uniref:hypothetical protein n=1 Tax=Sinomonas gamaensis TaxID=2565624 RepID=UPI0011087607|nr:hypothetical protein [Sinomonas gamaensis]